MKVLLSISSFAEVRLPKLVSDEEIRNPVAVRYAWTDNPEGVNLYNKENLPARPFRKDNF